MSEETLVEAAEPASEEINVDIDQHEQGEGENHLTFDEVDSLTSEKTDEEAVKEAKAMSTSEDKVAEVEAEAAEEGLENKVKEEVEAPIEKAKTLNAKFNEEALEVPAEAMFTHKVDGQEVHVPLQELLNNYAGKIPYDKKFQELATEKKTHQTEVEQINGYINTFAEKVGQKDVVGALTYFAEFAGMKPLEFKEMLREQLYPQYEKYSQLNEEQRGAFKLQEENDYLKAQQESDSKKRDAEQAHKELETQIKGVQETHNISDTDLLEVYDALVDNYKGEITPKVIADYYVDKQAFSKSEELLTNVAPDLVSDDKIVEAMAELVKENPGFTDNDWSDVIQEAYGPQKKSKSKAVSEKIKKSGTNIKQEQKVEQSKMDAFFFDDL